METMQQSVLVSGEEHDKVLGRRSLDLSQLLDDIPEERALSGKSSEEKEITRLDSGIGEWDSESSRKTSFSSQGRLSPDFAMDKYSSHKDGGGARNEPNVNSISNRDSSAKRRKSGIDMIGSKGTIVTQTNGFDSSTRPVVRTRLPRIAKSSRATGVWARKISPAGVCYLKMEDEMEEVMRNGTLVLVPRKISDHIPIVPIHSVDRFEVTEWNANLGLEDEDLQLYKTPKSDIYELHRHRWEFFGKMDFRKMMILALDGEAWMSAHRKYEIMKSLLSEKEQRKMEKMLAKGYSHEEVVEHFMEDAKKKCGNMELANKLQKLILSDDVDEEEMIEMLKGELGEESQKKVEELLKQGHSIKEVMKKMMEEGRTQEEEVRDTAETMVHLMKSKKKNIKTSQKEVQAMLDERLDDASKAKMKEMLEKGVPLKQVLDHFMKECEQEEQLTPLEKKMKELTKGEELSQYQMFELLKDQMDAESRKKMDEMVKSGCTLDEVIEHFMKKGKTKEQAQNEKSEQLRQQMEDSKDMTPEQVIEMLRSELSSEDKSQLEKMLHNGCSIQEVIDHFLNRGVEDEREEKTDFQTKIEKMLEGKNLNDDEILALMRSQVDDATKLEIKAMLEKGYSKQDIIKHLLKNTKTEEEQQNDQARKLTTLFENQEMSEEEKIHLLEKQLNEEDAAQMDEMLKRGCSIEEVIGHFMNRCQSPGSTKSSFAQNIEEQISGKNLSVDEILNIIEDQLDDESKQKMEEMLNKGYTKQDVVNYFLRTAKTKEEQMQETADKIKALMNDETMSEQSKLEILRNQLSKEDLQHMEEMLKDGGSLEDVMQQILKSKSSDSIVENDLSKMIHKAMTDNKDLSKKEILDLIRGNIDVYAQAEMNKMLEKGFSEQEVIDHFLACGKTVMEQQKETSEKLQSMLKNSSMTEEESIEVMRGALNENDKAQMEKMLQRGCSMEEVISHFTKRGISSPDLNEKPSEFSTKIKKLSDGQGLSVDQILTLMQGEIGDVGKAKMDEMLQKGYSKQDVIDYFLKNGKTQSEEKHDKAKLLSDLIDTKGMSNEEIESLMKKQLSPTDKKLMEAMLKEGKSITEIVKHFIEKENIDTSSDFSIKMKKMSDGKGLTADQILTLMEDELGDAGKCKMEEMLKEGFTKEEIIDYLLKNGKTQSEEFKETARKLSNIKMESMSDEEIKALMDLQLSPKDKSIMHRMLQEGQSVKSVLLHLIERAESFDPNVTDFAIKMKKLSDGKGLSVDELLVLIEGQIGESGKSQMEEMLQQGFTKEQVVDYFMKNGKTQAEEYIETAKKLQMLININVMSDAEISKVMEENLSPQDKTLMKEMLINGKSIRDVARHFFNRGEVAHGGNDFGEKMKKLSGGRKLSNEEMISLMKEQLGDTGKREMEDMLSRGISLEHVISHFMAHGQTKEEEQRLTSERLKNNMSDSMTDEELKGLLESELNDEDSKEMEEMLSCGYSMNEVLEHFQNRGGDNDGQNTELAMKVKKLSNNRKLSNEEMISLIKDQLSEEGKEQMNGMLETGMSIEDVIDHFMSKGKTQEQEHREVAATLRKLSGDRKLSSKELLDIMSHQLGKADKAQMAQMLQNGCSVEEVFDLFLSRGSSPHVPHTELARKVRRFSKDKLVPKKDLLTFIKLQLSEEGKFKLETMLQKGYKIDDVLEYFMVKGKTYEEDCREVGEQIDKLIDVKSMSDSKIIEIMGSVLSAFDKNQMEEMLRRGCTTPDIVDLFKNRGKALPEKTEFSLRMERLLEGKCLAPQDILEIMKDNLDDESKESIDDMLSKGYTVHDVIEHLLKNGKTPEQKQKEIAEKMLQLLDDDMSEDKVLQMMRKQLGSAGCKELEEMLSKGCSVTEILENFLHKPSELDTKEEDTEFAKKIKLLMGDKTLNAEEMLELIINELDPNSKLQVEEMIRSGCSIDEVIQHFMTRERNKKGQKRNEFGRKIYELTKDKKLTKKELICLMKNHLDEESLAKMEEMIKKGYPTEDIIDYFLKNGRTPNQLLREKALQKEKAKKEAAKKIHKMIDGHNLSNEEILAILTLQMGDDDKQQLENMINKGCSTKEIIQHFMNRDVSDDETEKTMFEKKMEELMDGKDLSQDEILKLMKSELDDSSLAKMVDMLNKGYTKDDVIKYFMKHGDEGNEFVQEMNKLTGGNQDMSKEEILDLMKSKLGVMSQKKMEDMMREGYSADEIIQHLMTHGKTQEQETKLFTRRMSIMLEGDKPLTDKEKVDTLKENLGTEAAFMIEELIKKGLPEGDIINLFLKHGNDLNSVVSDKFFSRPIHFPDEPLDASTHPSRNVFSIINRDEAKSKIPYMSPSGKNHIFALFFETVLAVINGKGLTHREILDLMRSRMGACYAKEFDELRKKGLSLQQIVDHFLKRDEETIAESRLVAKLKAEARVDSRVYLKREYSKEKWGVSLTYTFSKDHGLHLILDNVVENGPAWESGVRAGDVIVTVNDWLIVLMDRPQVAAHLFQAGANIVKLGIQKTRGDSPDRYLGITF